MTVNLQVITRNKPCSAAASCGAGACYGGWLLAAAARWPPAPSPRRPVRGRAAAASCWHGLLALRRPAAAPGAQCDMHAVDVMPPASVLLMGRLLLGTAIILSGDGGASAGGNIEPPNILFVVYDDLRPQLGAYGHPGMSTPHFDSLASESLVFNRAYTNYPYCAPSRNSFMSGRMPDHAQDWNFVDSFRQKDVHSGHPTPNVGAHWVALPQFFKEHGYWTVGSGKLYHPNLPIDNDNPKSWSENLTDFGGNSGCTCPAAPSATHPHAPMFCALPENTSCPDVVITDTVVSQLRRWDSTPALKAKPFFVGFGVHKVWPPPF
jgi:hypothetical protein